MRFPAILAWLLWLTLAASAQSADPPDQRPFLRIEAGMHTGIVRRIAVSEDGRLLATASDDKTARLWSLPDGRLLRTFRVPIGGANDGKINAVALSPDGRLLAAGGWDAYWKDQSKPVEMYAYLFDTVTGELVRRLGPQSAAYMDLGFSPDGRWLAATLSGGQGLRLWDANNGFAEPPAADSEYGDSSFALAFDRSGHIATTADDGFVRLYNLPATAGETMAPTQKGELGTEFSPFAIAFSPDGARLAIGSYTKPLITMLDAATLKPPAGESIDTAFAGNGDFSSVAWSWFGDRLYAGGRYGGADQQTSPIVEWTNGGRGPARDLIGPLATIMDMAPLPNGGMAWSSGDPAFGMLSPAGEMGLFMKPVTADMRAKRSGHFWNSKDGAAVWFGLEVWSGNPWIFDAANLAFDAAPERPADFIEPNIDELPITDWMDKYRPTLNGQELALERGEQSRSLAIAPDRQSFVLGAEWSLSRFDAAGQRLWRNSVFGIAWGVNLSSDGSLVIVAHGDGTLRWYRASDGAELLAFFVHAPDKKWVAWTPSGYYAASPGGEDLIGWHVNGPDWGDSVGFFPASRFREKFYRPDIVKLVLKTMDEGAAVTAANSAAKREAEERLTIADLPPVVELVADPRGIETDQQNLNLKYIVKNPSGEPVSRVEVRVDGQLVADGVPRSASEADESQEEYNLMSVQPNVPGADEISIFVPPRDAEVSIVAFHGDRASAPATVRILWRGPVKAKPERRLYALLVGVSQYEDPSLKLSYADKDAQDLAAVLKAQEGKFFKSVETTFLLNKDATEDNIETALADLATRAGPDDYTLVFMAGHGATRQNKFYFLPGNAETADNRLSATALRGSVIAESLNAMKGKVLFFIDACYSAQGLGIDMSGFINSVTGEENAVMMYASSSGSEVSYESSEWENGAFTEALLSILSDPSSFDEEGEIMTDELAVALRKKVRRLTNNRQTPVGQASRAVPPFPIAAL